MPEGPEYTFSNVNEPKEIIGKEEARELMDMRETARENGKAGEDLPHFRLIVHSGRVRIDHNRGEVDKGRGDIAKAKQTYKLIPFGEGENRGEGGPMYAAADKLPSDNTDARIEVRLNRFFFTQEPANSIYTAGEADTRDTPASGDGEVQLGGSQDVGSNNDFTQSTSQVPRAPEELTLHVEGGSAVSATVTFTGEHGNSTSRTYDPGANEIYENIAVPVTSLGSISLTVSDASGSNTNNANINAKVA